MKEKITLKELVDRIDFQLIWLTILTAMFLLHVV